MSTVADIIFPTSFAELAAMPSADLRILVGKLPNGTALHPKIASMGYHMSKAQRIDFIGYHYYGVGTAETAATALSAAEVKYAEHQAKKGTKTGPKKVKPAGGGIATNCAATAGKALASLAKALPVDTKLAADLGAWAKTGIKPTQADLSAIAKQISDASGDAAAVGPALDNIFDLDDLVLNWKAVLSVADSDNLGDAWLTAQLLTDAAKKVEGLSPELAAAAHAAAAEAAQSAITAAIPKVGLELLGASPSSPPAALVQALGELLELDFTKLPIPTLKGVGQIADQAIDTLMQTNLAQDELAGLVLDTLDGAVAKLATKVAKAADAVPPKYADELSGIVSADSYSSLQIIVDTAKDVAAAQASASADEAVAAAQQVYAAMTKAELKKLGPAAFKEAGVDVPSLAHYLTKDELAEALAKLDQGQPIGELLDIAKAKKLAHKQGGTAATKATKVPEPDGIPTLQAAPDTADTTVLTPAQTKAQTKATKKAKPTTAAEVQDSVAPEFTPHPDVLGTPQTKYPKPPQVQHTWSPKPKQSNLGGAHTKYQYVDEDGNVWMWKKADSAGVAKGEALAHDIGWDLGFDMADIRYAKGWQVPTKGTFPHGTVQKFHKGIKGDMTKVPLAAFDESQIRELQEHQVFDWLISQHDTHTENILVMVDGHLVPIDKGQAFKFFGADRLEQGWMPQGNFGRPVYYDLWDEYAAGRIDVDLDAIDHILARIESLDEAEYAAKVRAYVEQRMTDGGRSLSFLPPELRTTDALVEAILERKRSIRRDFTEFYKAQAKRRGVKWEPIWERRLKATAPEVIAEVGEAAVQAGITTPITPALAEDVQRLGTGGRAIHLAGKDVHQGQALVYVEQAADGTPILRMELRLEIDADDRLTETLRAITGDLGTGNAKATGGTGYIADSDWSTVEKFAKTVGAHAEDGAYNASTVAEAETLLGAIPAKKAKFLADADKALKKGDIDAWALAQAQAEKLDEYEAHLVAIKTAMDQGVTPPYKATAVDLPKAVEGWKAKAPTAVETITEEPTTDLFTSLTIGNDRYADMRPVDGFSAWRRSGYDRDVSVASHSSPADLPGPSVPGYSRHVGNQFDGTIDVDGTTVGISFRSYQQTAAATRKGLLDAEIVGWDGDSRDIERLLTMLDRLGVDAKLATAEDEALTYWRVVTSSMKQSVEYATGQGSGPYGKIRSTIDAIEKKVATSGNLTPSEEVAIYRQAWTETFGADAVARAPERLVHQRNIFGEEMGYGYVHRFDLPEDMSSAWGSQAGYVHGTRHLSATDVVDRGSVATTSELLRHGSIDLAPGQTTSASADLYTGGAEGTFTSPGWTHYANGQDFVIARPASAELRVGTYGYTGDRFGSMSQRQKGHYLDITSNNYRRSVGSGETMVRGGIAFGEDVEVVVYRTKAKREAALKALRDQGVTEIRGLPIEERILYARYDSDAQALVRRITAERSDSLFKPYADVGVTSRRVEPSIPKKAKKTRAKPKNPPPPEPEVPVATTTQPPPSPATQPTITNVGAQKTQMYEAAASQPTTAGKVDAVLQVDASAQGTATSEVLADLLGYGGDESAMVTEWLSATNKGLDFSTWAKLKAKQLDGPSAPTAAEKAAAGGLKIGTDPVPLFNAQPGDIVVNNPAEKVFNYAIPGVKGKLPVQFDKAVGGTKVMAQHTDGSWYLVLSTEGKTSKDDLIAALVDMGWPGVSG